MNIHKIDVKPFGSYKGKEISQYVLQNSKGTQVKIINYGATITSLTLSGAGDSPKEIVCGFDTLDGYFNDAYLKNAPYFGCTVGRYASRIKDGTFKIGDQLYKLAVNNGLNHLHGGITGFDKKVWDAEVIETDESSKLELTLKSPHLEEGYPGNVSVKVIFSLNDEHALSIKYEATSDRTTPLSLTNHTYFNLSGFENTIGRHKMRIHASHILEPDHTNVPVGKVTSVMDTPVDLRDGKILDECFKSMDTGFEHYYVFDNNESTLLKVAEVLDTDSGLGLDIWTTEPGALFYTGYFTSDELYRENGNKYGRYRGFCFETSRYPNGPNISGSPGSIIQPGELFESETIFKITNT